MKGRLKILVPIFVIILLFASALIYFYYFSSPNNVCYEKSDAYFERSHEVTKRGTFKNSYDNFNGTEIRAFNITKGTKIKFNFNSKVKTGSLNIDIKDPYGNTITSLITDKNSSTTIVAMETGRISLLVTGKNTSGFFKIKWRRVLF